MTSKAKRELSTQISKILKENEFYRIGGGWSKKENVLHIGVQPSTLDDQASKRYRKSIEQIKNLPNVQVAKSMDWWYTHKCMAGIIIVC